MPWLAVATALLLAASFFRPFWSLRLFAPQYPGGLAVTLYLDRATGDVEELDIINHYIGMAGLGTAAPRERAAAPFLVAALAVVALAMPFVRRRWQILVALPVVAFPLGVLGDLYYWLYRFGHTLDPAAPLRLDAFTPVILGWGRVGQFKTLAAVGPGFSLALAAAGLTAYSLWLTRRGARIRSEAAR